MDGDGCSGLGLTSVSPLSQTAVRGRPAARLAQAACASIGARTGGTLTRRPPDGEKRTSDFLLGIIEVRWGRAASVGAASKQATRWASAARGHGRAGGPRRTV
eukprot:7114853-Pyramimonas_sp.AAC.1